MLRSDKERVVAELAERLRRAETLIMADYRGLSVSEIDELRTKLLNTGARFTVVKNTLTRLAAQAAENEALLEYLDGPTAIAFIQPDGDPVAVAKVLSEAARTGRLLVIKGGLLEGRPVRDADIEELAKLPAADVLRGQVLGAVVAPLTGLIGLLAAPLQNLHGLLDARIEQLGGEAAPEPEDAAEEQPEAPAEEPAAEPEATAEAEAPAEGEAEASEETPEPAEPEAQATPTQETEEAGESTDDSDSGAEAPSSEVADATSDEPKEE
jgi:large subunit ribosomal protein L10